MTAQFVESILHPAGTSGVARITIPIAVIEHKMRATRKRFRIFGTSSKKFERSTSFLVACQVILYDSK